MADKSLTNFSKTGKLTRHNDNPSLPGKKIPTKEEVYQMMMKPKKFPQEAWLSVSSEECKFETTINLHLNKSYMLRNY